MNSFQLDEFLSAMDDASVRQSLKDSLEIDDVVLDGVLGVLREGFVL